MELNSVNTTPTVSVTPVVKKTVVQPSESAEDSISLSQDAVSAARLVEIVRNAPEARTELVARIKAQVTNGKYPPPYVIDSLARLMGIIKDENDPKK